MFNTLFLPEIREMLEQGDRDGLQQFCEAIHPAGTAEFMQGLTAEEAWNVLQYAEPASRPEIFLYFEPERQLEILTQIDRGQIAELITDMAPDDRVDLLAPLEQSTVDEILALIPTEDRHDILRLRAHPEDTAGAVMTTAVAKLPETLTVREALDALQQQSEEFETIYYLYIVDESDHLRGLVSTRELISHLKRPDVILRDIMETELITVDVDDDQEAVAQKVAKYDLLAIPVVDDQHHMLGIITYDDVIDVMVEEAVEDAHRIAGVDPLEASYLNTSLFTLSWKRGIWLAVLFVFALVTAMALKGYEGALEKWNWLVFFVPLIISSGGNSGSQSATLIITALVRGDIKQDDWWTVVRRELLSGLILGGFLAAMGLVAAYFFVDPEIPRPLRAPRVAPDGAVGRALWSTLWSHLAVGFRASGPGSGIDEQPFRSWPDRHCGYRDLFECGHAAAVASVEPLSQRF